MRHMAPPGHEDRAEDDPATWPVPPVGRIGRASDVAEAAVYLASDRASFVNGVVLLVDGGMRAGLPHRVAARTRRLTASGSPPRLHWSGGHHRPHLRPARRLAVLRAEPHESGDRGAERDRPRRRRVHRRPHDRGLSAGVQELGRLRGADPGADAHGAGQPRLAQRRLPALRGSGRSPAVVARRRRACASSASTPASPTSTRARWGAYHYDWIGEQFDGPAAAQGAASCTTICCRSRARGASAARSWMRATCSRCSIHAGVHVVLSGHKHVPYVWRLENMYVANAGTVSSLRVRGYTKPCYNVLEFDDGQVKHPGVRSRSAIVTMMAHFSLDGDPVPPRARGARPGTDGAGRRLATAPLHNPSEGRRPMRTRRAR